MDHTATLQVARMPVPSPDSQTPLVFIPLSPASTSQHASRTLQPPPYSPIDTATAAVPQTPQDPLLAAAMRDFTASQDPHQWGTRDSRTEARRLQVLLQQGRMQPALEEEEQTGWAEWFFNLFAIPEEDLRYHAMLAGRPAWSMGFGGFV